MAFCLLILVQVINRYALGLSLFWTEELVLLLFVWSVLLGMPAALWWRDEIVVDIIRLPTSLDGARLLLVDALSIAFLLALTWSGLAFMQRGGISLAVPGPAALVVLRKHSAGGCAERAGAGWPYGQARILQV